MFYNFALITYESDLANCLHILNLILGSFIHGIVSGLIKQNWDWNVVFEDIQILPSFEVGKFIR